MNAMSTSAMARSVCVTTGAVAGLVSRTVAMAAGSTSRCDVSEYYDVSAGACKHCDTACFEYDNGTIVSFTESRCLQMCPGYVKAPRVPQYPRELEVVPLTLMEGCLIGFVLALVIVCVVVLVLLRSEIYHALKDCCLSARTLPAVGDVCGHSQTDVNEGSYVKLADPSDEVEIIDRVTSV